MNVLRYTLELVALSEKTKPELIGMIQKLNVRIEELNDAHTTLLKSKKEGENKNGEEIAVLKKIIASQTESNKQLEEKNKILGNKLEIKLGNVYNAKLSWVNKIIFVLKQAARPLRSSEIIETLLLVDTELVFKDDAQKSLSVHLTKALKYGRIIGKRQNGQNGYLFSLPEESLFVNNSHNL